MYVLKILINDPVFIQIKLFSFFLKPEQDFWQRIARWIKDANNFHQLK